MLYQNNELWHGEAAVAGSAAAGTAGTTKRPFFIFNFRFSYKPDMPYRY